MKREDSNGFIVSMTPRASHALTLSRFFRPERLLQASAICVAAYIGAYIRVGVGYYKIWKTETNYSVMYTQMLGCFIMGFISQHKSYMLIHSKNKSLRCLYTAIASGLCGSITTFSSWMLVCNNNFYLQWDLTGGGFYASYNGGRIFEFFTSLIAGVAVPLFAHHFGIYLASFTPYNEFEVNLKEQYFTSLEKTNENKDESLESAEKIDETSNKDIEVNSDRKIVNSEEINKLRSEYYVFYESWWAEVLILFLFFASTCCIILIPVFEFPTWIMFTYTGIFGAVGAYLRYQLSFLNRNPHFPVGTFYANIFGTFILALTTVLSKFVTPYYEVETQAVLYGIATGFSGCLTTVSTFVSEIDKMSYFNAYRYATASIFTAQLGIVLILNIYSSYSITSIPTSSSSSVLRIDNLYNVDYCSASYDLCDVALNSINCPIHFQNNIACDQNKINLFVGICTCANASNFEDGFITQRPYKAYFFFNW